MKQKMVKSTDYKVVNAFKGEPGGAQVLVAILEMGSNVKIIINETNGQLQVMAITLEKEDGQEVFKELRIVNQRLEAEKIVPCAEKNIVVAQKIKEQELSILTDNTKDIQTAAVKAPCLYGRWCGPGCSGPGDPIDKLLIHAVCIMINVMKKMATSIVIVIKHSLDVWSHMFIGVIIGQM